MYNVQCTCWLLAVWGSYGMLQTPPLRGSGAMPVGAFVISPIPGFQIAFPRIIW